MLKEKEQQQQQQQQQQVQVSGPHRYMEASMGPPAPLQPALGHSADGELSLEQRYSSGLGFILSLFGFQQQKKKRDTRKSRRKKDVDDDGEEKELMERLKKLSVPASDEEEEGKCPEGKWVPGTL